MSTEPYTYMDGLAFFVKTPHITHLISVISCLVRREYIRLHEMAAVLRGSSKSFPEARLSEGLQRRSVFECG